MIRRIALLLAATAISGAAMAADIVTPAPSAPSFVGGGQASVMDWGGFHIGLQGGYAHSRQGDGLWINNRYSAFNAGFPRSLDVGGMTGGLRAGYDVQFGNGLVLGAMLEGNLADMEKGYSSSFFGFPYGVKTRISNFGIASLRFGYAWNQVLFYGTAGGGLASAEVRAYDSLFGTNLKSSSSLSGYSLGGGIDYAINPNLVVGVGYRYLDLDNKTVFRGTTADTRIGGQVQTVQGSISFKY